MYVLQFLVIFALLFSSSVDSVPTRHRATRHGTHFYTNNDGYYYHCNRIVRTTTTAYMKCVHYEAGCLGRGIWRAGHDIEHTQRHECHRDFLYVMEMDCRRRILQRCRRLEATPFRTIIREEIRGLPVDVQLRLNYNRLRTSMRNARLSSLPLPPPSLAEFSIMLRNNPNLRAATMAANGQDNLYRGSVTARNGSHSILFATNRMLRFARRQPIFFVNGTFKTVPARPEAAQILTIVTARNHHVIPIAWALMERQTASAYISVFRLLRVHLGPDFRLQQVLSDFEQAIHLRVNYVFGPHRVQLQGCFFHLARAFVKYAKRNLNLYRYMARGPVRMIIRLCIVLALLPLRLVNRGFALIMILARREGLVFYRRIRPFLNYVSRRWIHHRERRRRMNCCGSENRTNNISESHNRQLSRHIQCRHPDIYRFLMGISDFEEDAFLSVNAINRGQRIHRPRRIRSILMDQRLHNYIHDLMPRHLHNQLPQIEPNNRTILRFLRRASYLFEGVYDDALVEM